MNFQAPYPFQNPAHLMDPQAMAMKTLNATLYIGDIDDQLNEGTLYQFFIKYGPIYSVRIMRDVYNQKKSRGFGYVTYYSAKDAEAARINANHEVILKKPIRVTWKKNFRELDREANVYIRNINPSITIKELDSYFSKFGAIFSSKIALDDEGKSLGYGYVQFEKKEQAEACVKQAEFHKVKDCECKVEKFQPSKVRDKKDVRNNLYVKNLPEDVTKEKLIEVFQQFGEIISVWFKKDEKINKYFCFCCYKTNLEAAKCLTEISDKDPFGVNEKLYITYAEKKDIRTKKLREAYANIINETNLFTKNILNTVTELQLKEAFSKYGQITSIFIKVVASQDPKYQVNGTNCGFICYANRDDAKKALAEAPRDKLILDFYKDKNMYLTYHYRKEQYQQYKEMKRRTMAKYFAYRQFANPMFIQFPMPPPMFANQFVGAPNFPPHQMMSNHPYPAYHHPHPAENNNGYRPPLRKGPPRKHYDNTYKKGSGYKSQKVYQKHETPIESTSSQPAAEQTQKSVEAFTIPHLKGNLNEFLSFSQDKQRGILGELLFPLVQKHVSVEAMAPKVTGMLIDFTVFEVGDIIEFLDNDEILRERVQEAESLIESTG